jgi:uncharacterized protein (TIGR03437 family)
MLRTSFILILCIASFGYAQTGTITVTSAASNSPDLSAESLATATGTNLAAQSAIAQSVPWPTSLGGVTVEVMDSGNVSRAAGLLFVSPGQINFEIPAGTALGYASVTVHNGSSTFTTLAAIKPVAPALFAVDPSGIAAATGMRVTIPTQIQSPIAVFLCLDAPGSCHLVPIVVGVDTPIYLSFYGTGISGRARLENVAVKVGSESVGAIYAGPQGQFPGLDQVNIALPISLRGAGVVDVTVTADGVASNAVKINVQ